MAFNINHISRLGHSTSLLEEMENSATAMAPLLLRNLLTSIIQIFRHFLVSIFLYLFRIIPSFVPSLNSSDQEKHNYLPSPSKFETVVSSYGGGSGDPCIARALSQLLSIMDEVPLNSRKYETVKSLAEKLIIENLDEGCEALREVNTAALSAAFSRTLGKLEVAVMEQASDHGDGGGDQILSKRSSSISTICSRLKWVYRKVGYYGDGAWTRVGKTMGTELNRSGCSAEKLCVELLWLSEKLAACGSVKEAVRQWASASNLAWLALLTEPWLQGSLLRISAFLLKQAKDQMGGEGRERTKREELRQIKLKVLMSWIPFLCCVSGAGIDAPVLSLNEKSEVERDLDEIIRSLRKEEDQEKVLTLWLHHFTHCPSSNWPNLHSSYARWCQTSRTRLMVNQVRQNHEDIGL